MAAIFHSLVQVNGKSGSTPHIPEPLGYATNRTNSAVSRIEHNDIELDRLHPDCQVTPNDETPSSQSQTGNLRPRPSTSDEVAGSDIEMSPAFPDDAVDMLPSLSDPPMNLYRLITCCSVNFVGGLTDAAPGALIPYMETYVISCSPRGRFLSSFLEGHPN